MSKPVTRRQFLGTSGKTAAGVAAGLTMHTMIRDARAEAANNTYTGTIIGCGDIGRRKLQNFMDSGQVNVAALCDVDPNQIENVQKFVTTKLNQTAKHVKDYRDVANMKDVDMVIVA